MCCFQQCLFCLEQLLQHLMQSWLGATSFSQLQLVCKAFELLQNLDESLLGQTIFGCRSCLSITLSIRCHSLLACRVSAKESTYKLKEVTLYIICCFFHIAFSIFSFTFCEFYYCIFCCVTPLVYPAWDSLPSWAWAIVSFPTLRKFSAIISLNIFLGTFAILF